MADNAFEWARQHNRLYKSEIHGEEEADIPLDMNWSKTKETGNKVGFTSGFTMDVPRQTTLVWNASSGLACLLQLATCMIC